jgi:hypothetical protein
MRSLPNRNVPSEIPQNEDGPAVGLPDATVGLTVIGPRSVRNLVVDWRECSME